MGRPEILISQIRKARQTRVEHDGKVFIVRRPKDSEYAEIRKRPEVSYMEFLERFVEGWENFSELDIVPGGDATPVEFHKELFLEWVADKADFWLPLYKAIVEEYISHCESLAEAEKK
jgi:hypothetical protein